MPFIGPLKEERTPHTSFRRHSRGRMSHAFYRTAQGRLPKPMSSKGKTTFFIISLWFSGKVARAAMGWIVDTEPGLVCIGWIRQERAAAAT